MKRLLLLFLLFPVMLFGQARRKGVIDSIKATTVANSQNVLTILGNPPGSRVEQTNIIDSGEYLTIVTRIRAPKAELFTAVSTLPITAIKIENIPVRKMDTVNVPPLPGVIPSPDPIEVLETVRLAIRATTPLRKTDTVTVPFFEPLLDNLPLLSPIKFVFAVIHFDKLHMVAVPNFEIIRMPVAEMHLSPEGYSLLEKLEGFSPYLYALKDGGFTIGFGFFLPYAEGAKWDKGVTMEEAEVMIRQKMPAYENQVKRYINVPLTQNEFDALTMLAYNLGGFSKATSIVNDINTQADFDKLQSDWNRFVHSKAPNVTKGLMNRRRDEIRVRGEAYYQPERKLNILKNK
ncbi:MAG: hypothetical protein JWQ38_970 [Flavipsychrobacter sp.]|nr:hypothetical protein [Flavipsychrobacter sp.]